MCVILYKMYAINGRVDEVMEHDHDMMQWLTMKCGGPTPFPLSQELFGKRSSYSWVISMRI